MGTDYQLLFNITFVLPNPKLPINFTMHSSFTLVVAALAASASALNVRAIPYGYLPPISQPYSTAPIGSVYSTGVVPTGGTVTPTGKGPYKPTGTGYQIPPGTGVSPIGSGAGPTGTGVAIPPVKGPTGTGKSPIGTGKSPIGTGKSPIGTGSGYVGPTGTGSGSPPGITPPAGPITTTVYGPGTTTITSTSVGTTTFVSTISKLVLCSEPISTSLTSTYYSTSLTTSYSTTTVTSLTTQVQVICPSTTAGSQVTGVAGSGSNTSGSNSPGNGNGSNSGTGSSGSNGNGNNGANGYSTSNSNSPINGNGANGGSNNGANGGGNGANGANGQSYSPTTVFGPAPAPTSGTCAPAQTVYSTVVVSVTVPAGGATTPCSACKTYVLTLPNGSPYTAVVTSTSTAGPQDSGKPTGAGSPPYPYPGQGGSGPKGSGSSYIMSNGPTAAPSASGTYRYGKKVYA